MDHTPVALRAVVRALSDVVAPAVDPGAAAANEQLRLAIDYIEFLALRLDRLQDRERFELEHHLEMARIVHELAAPIGWPGSSEMQAAIASAASIEGGFGSTDRIRGATAALASAIGSLIRGAPTLDPLVGRAIEQQVVVVSKDRIAFERSWYLPLGFDPDREEVLPLTHWLGPSATPAADFNRTEST